MSDGRQDGFALAHHRISTDSETTGSLNGKLLPIVSRGLITPTNEENGGSCSQLLHRHHEDHQAHLHVTAQSSQTPNGSEDFVKRHSHSRSSNENLSSTDLDVGQFLGTDAWAKKNLALRIPERQDSLNTVEGDRNGSVVVPRSHGSIFSRKKDPSKPTMSPVDSVDSTYSEHKSYTIMSPIAAQARKLSSRTPVQEKRLPPRLRMIWEEIKPLRLVIWALRSRLSDLRRLAHQKQEAISKAENKFFRYITRVREEEASQQPTTTPEGISLESLYEACKAARIDYGPVEEELMSLESQAGTQEHALQKLETKLYEQNIDFASVVEEDIYLGSPPSSNASASQISYNLHPLVNEYLSKLGDVEILQERLESHFDEKENLEEERSKRQRVGLKLAESDQEWLDDFEEVHAEIGAQLEVELKVAEELRQKAFAMGLLNEHGEPRSFEEREQLTFQVELNEGYGHSGYVQFPALLPPPSGLQIQLQDSSPIFHPLLRRESVDPRLRVDQWLLHQLRMSPLGVKLLEETYTTQYGALVEPGQWQQDVLKQWYRDKASDWKSAPHTISTEALEDNETLLASRLQPTSSPEIIKDMPTAVFERDRIGTGLGTDNTPVHSKVSRHPASLPEGIY